MRVKVKSLREMLKEIFGEDIPADIPRKYKIYGDIAVVKIPSKYRHLKKEIGDLILKNDPRIRSVVNIEKIHGTFREPIAEVIAGDPNTVTTIIENSCRFKLDVAKLMFCLGNQHERVRLANIVFSDEVVVDMFAGVGQFSIPIAVHCKPERIFAIEINPTAFRFLVENIFINHVEEVIFPILGNCREVIPAFLKGRADRIIMGFIEYTNRYLDAALVALRDKGGIIHFHNVYNSEDAIEMAISDIKDAAERSRRRLVKVIHRRIVKEYGPKLVHVVIDAKIK